MRAVSALFAFALALSGCVATGRSAGDERAADGYRAQDDAALVEWLDRQGFSGQIGISRRRGSVHVDTIGGPVGDDWPWASVTKQVVAVLVMQQVEAGTLALDDPLTRWIDLDAATPAPTIRQLLQHRSGLRNPDDSPLGPDDWPDFYTDGATGPAWCLQDRTAPPETGWRYNNCDFLVLGAVLERATGESVAALLDEGIARPAGMAGTRFLDSDDLRDFAGRDVLYDRILPRFGAAGALVGPLEDMLAFDRALLDGKLLGEAARAQLWASDPALGYMALGQWMFEAPLAGCDSPLRIVERRGAIGKYQVRNMILPDRDIVLALVTDRPEPGFSFGEIWTGSGTMHDVLSQAACER